MNSSDPVFQQVNQHLSPQQKKLIEDIRTIISCLQENHISDYSFLVAPAAKAYEGYLKDFFLKLGIIDQYNYESDRFRVGKTLNPSLRYKRYSIFQKLSDLHQDGEQLAEILWDAWKFGRNEILHYFPKNVKSLSREEAEERIHLIFKAIIESDQFLKDNQVQDYSNLL